MKNIKTINEYNVIGTEKSDIDESQGIFVDIQNDLDNIPEDERHEFLQMIIDYCTREMGNNMVENN